MKTLEYFNALGIEYGLSCAQLDMKRDELYSKEELDFIGITNHNPAKCLLPETDAKKFWSLISRMYDAYATSSPVYFEKLADFLLGQIGDAKTCLDLGAGTGLHMAYLAKNCPNIHFVALDKSEDMLSKLHDKKRRLGLENMDVLQGDFKDFDQEGKLEGRLNLIYSADFGDWMCNSEILEKLKTKLSSNGQIILVKPVQFRTESTEEIEAEFSCRWQDFSSQMGDVAEMNSMQVKTKYIKVPDMELPCYFLIASFSKRIV